MNSSSIDQKEGLKNNVYSKLYNKVDLILNKYIEVETEFSSITCPFIRHQHNLYFFKHYIEPLFEYQKDQNIRCFINQRIQSLRIRQIEKQMYLEDQTNCPLKKIIDYTLYNDKENLSSNENELLIQQIFEGYKRHFEFNLYNEIKKLADSSGIIYFLRLELYNQGLNVGGIQSITTEELKKDVLNIYTKLLKLYKQNIMKQNEASLSMYSEWKKEKEKIEIEFKNSLKNIKLKSQREFFETIKTKKNRIEVVSKSKDKPVFVFKEQNEIEKKTFIEALSIFITLPFVIATPFEQRDSKKFATNIYSYLQGEVSYEEFSKLDTIAKLLLFNQHDVGLICLRLFFQSTSDFGAISNQQHTELTRRIYTLFNLNEEKLKITSFSKTIRGNIFSPKFSSKLKDIDSKELQSQIKTFVDIKTENKIVELFRGHIKNAYKLI